MKYLNKLTDEELETLVDMWIFEGERLVEYKITEKRLTDKEDGYEITIEGIVDCYDEFYTTTEVYQFYDFGVALGDLEYEYDEEDYPDKLIEYREWMLNKFGNQYAIDYLFDLEDSDFNWNFGNGQVNE